MAKVINMPGSETVRSFGGCPDPFAQGLDRAQVLLLLQPAVRLKGRPSAAWQVAYRLYLRTDHWAEVKVETLVLLGYACQLCDSLIGLQVHHRPGGYRALFREVPGKHTIVLCSSCHRRHHRK